MIYLAAVAVFALAVTGLSVGVILRKKTPLKGNCHGDNSCDQCTCGH